ncbi:MAG: type IV toxin-antitoxin system AbiEi family antitoxin domain-containing protein [Spirochaetales bacterium]|nr:type IV toxin-antitoxin system AbiEi family antitoxin domain-containing protein [Spirochaetales bacterium]
MNKADTIREFANRGYFSLSQCAEHGVTRYEVSELLKSGIVKKIKYGLYAFSDVIEDELFIPQVFSDKVVYSNETALYFDGYSDQIPFTYTLTVPKGYHSKRLWDDFMIRQTPPEIFDEGITEVRSPYGNPIRVYCIERTLCDLIKSRTDFNKQRFIPAVQKYMQSRQKDLYKIAKYAQMLKVENKIRPYMEALL